MIGFALTALLAGAAPAAPAPERYAQVTIRERIIVRVPTRPPVSAVRAFPEPPQRPMKWKERKAPDCVAIRSLAGADASRKDSIDLILRGGERIRAKLENRCPALDFYSGFYLKPNKDGQVCADRDVIRSRSGGQCQITAFRRLVPDR